MNSVELAAQLQKALTETGRTPWELSRQANVHLPLVEALLGGVGAVPVEALVRVVEALQLEVSLTPIQPHYRQAGPVRSLVDNAIEKLHSDHRTGPDDNA